MIDLLAELDASEYPRYGYGMYACVSVNIAVSGLSHRTFGFGRGAACIAQGRRVYVHPHADALLRWSFILGANTSLAKPFLPQSKLSR